MKLNHVIVIFKIPTKIEEGLSKKLLSRIKHMQISHERTIEQVKKVLNKYKVGHTVIERNKILLANFTFNSDLIITIGGDGTVLATSRIAGETPILGVNSMPKTSVGFFSAATASNFEKILLKIIKDQLIYSELPLLEISIDGKKMLSHAQNDVLFAASSPAATTQYIIKIGGRSERQRSSGVWIAAGPGSTAAIASAGGKVMPIKSERIQYLARELYPIPGIKYHLRNGFVPNYGSIKIVSEINDGMVYLDGTKISYAVSRGNTLEVKIAKEKLRIFLSSD